MRTTFSDEITDKHKIPPKASPCNKTKNTAQHLKRIRKQKIQHTSKK